MSGGHWNYLQHQLLEIADEIARRVTEPSIHYDADHRIPSTPDYKPETKRKMRAAASTIRRAAKMMQRLDWWFSADDAEDSFNERWMEDLAHDAL